MMAWLFILGGLPLGRLSIIKIPKALTIWLRTSQTLQVLSEKLPNYYALTSAPIY